MTKIDYNHPNYEKIEAETQKQFDQDFNCIPLDIVEKYCEELPIINPSFQTIIDEWLDNHNQDEIRIKKRTKAVYDWLEENYYDQIMDFWYDSEHYPMWGTVFEADDYFLSEKVEEMVNELYKIGIGVIESYESLNTMLFINGAGYNFYKAHWIPMYQLFGWISNHLLNPPKEGEFNRQNCLDHDGEICPYCGSDDVESNSFNADMNYAWCQTICHSCKKVWGEVYTLTDIEEIE